MTRYIPFLTVILIFLVSCSVPDNVNMPQWNTELNLPLTHRYYTLGELIKTDKYISIDSANGFLFKIHYADSPNKSGVGKSLEGKMNDERNDINITITEGEGTAGIPLPNGLVLDSARFKGGSFTIKVYNNSSSPLDVSMTFPAMISSLGHPLKKEGTIPANDSLVSIEYLPGYIYYANKQNIGADSLQIDGSIAGSDFNGNLKVNYKFENTKFSYIAGIVAPTKIDPVNQFISLPITDDVIDFRDKINLHSAELVINANYIDAFAPSDPNIPFEIGMDSIIIYGVREDESEKFYLKYTANNDNNLGPQIIQNKKLEMIFDKNNSNLPEFLSFMPDSIIIYAIPTVNPNRKRGAVSDKDSTQFKFDLTINSVVSFDKITATDTTEFDMDDDARDNIRDFRAATIYLKIDNDVAFGGNLVFDFTDEEYNNLFSLDTINFEPAIIDAEGNPTVTHFEPTIELDSAQVQFLANSYYTIMHVNLNSSGAKDSKQAIFSSKDSLSIISFFKVKYHVNIGD